MSHKYRKQFFLQRLPATLAVGLLAVLLSALLVGGAFEFLWAPGFGWEGRPFLSEGTTGSVTLADLDGDGRQERLIAPKFNTTLPPSIKINRAQPDQPLGNRQYFVAGRHALFCFQAATSADGAQWLAALTASRDSTTIFLSLFKRQAVEEDFKSWWQGPLFTPADHPHNWQNAPTLSAFLFVPTSRGERALFSLNAAFLGWRGVVEADLSGQEPSFVRFPCGSSQNRCPELLGTDPRGRTLLYSEGLAAGNGNALGGIDDSWGGLLVFDPDSGFRKGLDLGRAHKSFGLEVAPDGRHLLLHTAMFFAPQPGDTFNLAMVDGWSGRILWKQRRADLINAEWGAETSAGDRLPDVLVLATGRLSRCRPEDGVGISTVSLPTVGQPPKLKSGLVLILAPDDELRIFSSDGRSRGRIPVSDPMEVLPDPQGSSMDRLVMHVVRAGFVDSYAMVPVPAWRRMARQAATWWALAVGVLAWFTVLGFRIHHQEQLLRGIVDDNAQAVALLDLRGGVLYANREFDNLWANETVRTRLEPLLQRPATEDGQVLEVGGRWLRGFRRPLVRGRRTVGSVWIGFDETAEREAGEGRKFRSLAGLITHELKSPMTPLRLGLDQLRREVEAIHPGGSPGVERVLSRMGLELEHMHQLVGQFMRLAGERQPERRLDLRQVVRQALERAAVHQLPGIRLDLQLAAEPVRIVGDGEGIAMALCSLLTNALEAMERHGSLGVRLHAARGEDGSPGWRLLIEDTGPGIPDELREHIWEAGFSTKPDGYGYGLFFARKVLRQNGATLRLERAEGGGTLAFVEWRSIDQVDA